MILFYSKSEPSKIMKPTMSILNTISKSRQSDKFKMFISHIGEHIDKDASMDLDKELHLNFWISSIQEDEKMTSSLAHEIATWIEANISLNGLSC